MKYLKRFNENLNDVTQFIKEIGIPLNDINLRISFQVQYDKIVLYISNPLTTTIFSLADIREEVEHIISYMEDSGYKLLSARKMTQPKRYWISLYDSKLNRWGVAQSKDIFDIQDYDNNKKEILSFELKFSN
jgi:hypothetical protein